MNILQVLPELNVGGVERGTVDLARRLVEDGHKSIVISWGGRLEEKLDVPGIKHYNLPVHKKSLINMFRLVPRIAWIMKNEEIDIVHARSRVPAIIAYFAYRKYVAKRPIDVNSPVSFITTCHGYYNTHIFSRIMGYGKLVIVPSQVIGKHMNKNFGVPLDRIRFIPRGVDVDEFSYQEPKLDKTSDFVVGMVGRITPLKGHEDFLKAMSKVVRMLPKTKIIIAGNVAKSKEDYKRKLDLLVKLLGLDRHVEFVGVIDDVASLMKKLDLLVLATTTQEAFGRVIIEAFACGVPVLATAVGGVVDIISHKKNGILIPKAQPNIMAQEIKSILKNRELSLELSLQGRISAEENYTLKNMLDSTIQVYGEANCIFKILVIKLSAIGDIILSLPSLKAIRDKFPRATICAVTSLAGREILSKSGFVDEVIVCQRRNTRKLAFNYLWDFSKKLRNIGFDLAIDMQNSKKSHLISYLSSAPNRYGYKSSKFDFFLNHAIMQPKKILSPILHQAFLLKNLGIEDINPNIEINIPQKDEKYIDKLLTQEWLKKGESLIALNPFASAKWQTKVWPLSNYAELIDRFSEKNIRTIITGVKDTRDLAHKLCKMVESKPILFTGKTTMLQLAALFKRCKVVITPDSAPLHLAVAVNIPCVALFGPTDPEKHIPRNSNVDVLRKDLYCVPCYRRTCNHNSCMKEISVDEVFSAVNDLL